MSGEALVKTQESLPAHDRDLREDPEGPAHQQLRERLLELLYGLVADWRWDFCVTKMGREQIYMWDTSTF